MYTCALYGRAKNKEGKGDEEREKKGNDKKEFKKRRENLLWREHPACWARPAIPQRGKNTTGYKAGAGVEYIGIRQYLQIN